MTIPTSGNTSAGGRHGNDIDRQWPGHQQDDPQWADGSITQMRAQALVHALAIHPVICADIALSFATLEMLAP